MIGRTKALFCFVLSVFIRTTISHNSRSLRKFFPLILILILAFGDLVAAWPRWVHPWLEMNCYGLGIMPFGNSHPESQRDSLIQPRVASLRATLGKFPNDDLPQRGCIFPLILDPI